MSLECWAFLAIPTSFWSTPCAHQTPTTTCSFICRFPLRGSSAIHSTSLIINHEHRDFIQRAISYSWLYSTSPMRHRAGKFAAHRSTPVTHSIDTLLSPQFPQQDSASSCFASMEPRVFYEHPHRLGRTFCRSTHRLLSDLALLLSITLSSSAVVFAEPKSLRPVHQFSTPSSRFPPRH